MTKHFFLLHSLGVPYHAWRITHGQHHAATGHLTNDQVFVPKSRSQIGLPPLDPSEEDILGSHVSEKAMNELREALGDSPIGAAITGASYLARVFIYIDIPVLRYADDPCT